MKLLSSLVLALTVLAALAGTSAAQNAPVPNLTSIPPRKSWAPGNLVLLGTNLGLAFTLNLDGQPVPILRVGPTRLIAGPLAPRAPGFGAVELISGRNVETGTVEFVPNLTAIRRGLSLSIRMRNGEPGTFVLRYSYGQINPIVDPGVFNPRYLGVNADTILAGVFPDGEAVLLPRTPVPITMGGIGAMLRLQATCTGANSGAVANTNLVLVQGFGNPQAP